MMKKDTFIVIFVTVFLLLRWSEVSGDNAARKTSNVIDFGAIGDGTTDDTLAFAKAWAFVCGASSGSELIIPKSKTFLLKPIKFPGPCKSKDVSLQILGDVVAPSDISSFGAAPHEEWLDFSNIDGLTISGGGSGQLNGQGRVWWSTCTQQGKNCQQRPNVVTIRYCKNITIQDLKFIDSPGHFIVFVGSDGVKVSKVHILAPKDSPNTDGINLVGATNVHIDDSNIGVGDDCISLNNHAHDVNITNVNCGPGHGISIGSLGHDIVEKVRVSNCNLTGTLGGVKIKTWQGGNGYARNILFENISVSNVIYPILIDQYYCPNRTCALNETSAIKISDISFKNIYGTSATQEAVTLNCSRNTPCTNLDLDLISITSALSGKEAYAQCINAHGRIGNIVSPKMNCIEQL